MEADDIWRHIDEQRSDLADFLETLTPQQWATPSLCTGWTVRDVVAHLTQSKLGWRRLLVEGLRSGFRFNAMVSRCARQDTSTPEELVATLRSMVGSRRKPPGTAVVDPLMDTLVHGQDIAIPLGVSRSMPVPLAVLAAERLWTMGFPFNAKRRFRGTKLTATDADFSVGTGQEIKAPIQDIVLTLAGRETAFRQIKSE
ncbi:maleylpyruvate isomerase family mycothiol-dependent enzyme [Mycobacterium hubeiense]|uniref:maleylpyruvate isomerase family mycothiol-dependent enzyme n=1 Tax=Mycobacterium hubeiense TaxID=1867256 RepID=UPI000C7F46F8|nr:maleylpyruvate isomerase family mycothiol-dependent enzyme [Mycobacterium sp. QGD 101]